MQQKPENVNSIVYAMCVLHNLLIVERPKEYLRTVTEQPAILDPPDYSWQLEDVLDTLAIERGVRPDIRAKAMRDHLCSYYGSVGAVSWQDDRIVSTKLKYSSCSHSQKLNKPFKHSQLFNFKKKSLKITHQT